MLLMIRVATGLLIVVLTGAGLFGGLDRVSRPGGELSPPRQSASPPGAAPEAGFRAGFTLLLEQAIADARVLVATGEARDRNLLRIRAQQEAMLGSLSAADAWLDANPAPARVVPAVAAYREGATAIRAAMDEAQAGFLRFDFGRVARATETMGRGEAALSRALTLLQSS